MPLFSCKSLSVLLFLLVLVPELVYSANILFFHLLATSSHRISIWPLAEKLADSGHNVTYIFPMDSRRFGSHQNIKELVPSKMLPIITEFVGDFDINIRLNITLNQWHFQVFTKSVELCEAFYESPEIKKWLSDPSITYDLLMLDGLMGECAYGLVSKFKSKFILFYPTPLAPFTFDALGFVPESASIPDLYFHKKPDSLPGSLINRVLSTLSVFMWRLGALDFMRRIHPIIQKNFPVNEIPNLWNFERNASLLLVNSYFVEEHPMSLPPVIQSYSGLWCSKSKLKKRKALPEDLDKFINGAKDGFVYVSLGSAVMASGMPVELRDKFFSAFEKLPNLRFLWRWPGNGKNIPENLPKNVVLKNWFPQHDLLGHPKIRAFVTQAGRPSTQEAFCHGVPMVAMPIFADQDYNADRLEQIGAAVLVNIENVTGENFKQAIESVAYSESYKIKAKELSAMFRDRPVDPLENAFYWVEYALKYDTSLLKPLGRNQHWWQRRLLDVYSFIGLVMVITMLSSTGILFYLLRKMVCRKQKAKTE